MFSCPEFLELLFDFQMVVLVSTVASCIFSFLFIDSHCFLGG